MTAYFTHFMCWKITQAFEKPKTKVVYRKLWVILHYLSIQNSHATSNSSRLPIILPHAGNITQAAGWICYVLCYICIGFLYICYILYYTLLDLYTAGWICYILSKQVVGFYTADWICYILYYTFSRFLHESVIHLVNSINQCPLIPVNARKIGICSSCINIHCISLQLNDRPDERYAK